MQTDIPRVLNCANLRKTGGSCLVPLSFRRASEEVDLLETEVNGSHVVFAPTSFCNDFLFLFPFPLSLS